MVSTRTATSAVSGPLTLTGCNTTSNQPPPACAAAARYVPPVVGLSIGDIIVPDRRIMGGAGAAAPLPPKTRISINTSVWAEDANGLDNVSPSNNCTRMESASPNASRRTHEGSTRLRNWVCLATAYSRYCASARSIFTDCIEFDCTKPYPSNETPSSVGLACCRLHKQRLSSGSLATKPCKNAERLEIRVCSARTSAEVNLQSPDTSPHIAPPPTASHGSIQGEGAVRARRCRENKWFVEFASAARCTTEVPSETCLNRRPPDAQKEPLPANIGIPPRAICFPDAIFIVDKSFTVPVMYVRP